MILLVTYHTQWERSEGYGLLGHEKGQGTLSVNVKTDSRGPWPRWSTCKATFSLPFRKNWCGAGRGMGSGMSDVVGHSLPFCLRVCC